MELKTTLKVKIDLAQLPPDLVHKSLLNELGMLWLGYIHDRDAGDVVGAKWHERQITKILMKF